MFFPSKPLLTLPPSIPLQASVGEELGSLSQLHTLSLHLDSPDHPVCCPDLRKIGTVQVVLTYEQMKAADRMLRSQADLLAPLLSRSVRLLRLVERDTMGAAWRAYRISRADGATGNDAVCARHDRAYSTEVSFVLLLRRYYARGLTPSTVSQPRFIREPTRLNSPLLFRKSKLTDSNAYKSICLPSFVVSEEQCMRDPSHLCIYFFIVTS